MTLNSSFKSTCSVCLVYANLKRKNKEKALLGLQSLMLVSQLRPVKPGLQLQL